MKYDPDQHHRRSVRLPGYDYTQAGWYFVTLVTQGRACLFEDATLRLVAETLWQQIPRHCPQVSLDEWIVMPNHLHGILVLSPGNTTAPDVAQPAPPRAASSLGAIIASYKSVTTRRLHQMRGLADRAVWQRNYFERVIRSQRELAATRQYIVDNPAQWTLDEYFDGSR